MEFLPNKAQAEDYLDRDGYFIQMAKVRAWLAHRLDCTPSPFVCNTTPGSHLVLAHARTPLFSRRWSR